jgi:hypothetical protein
MQAESAHLPALARQRGVGLGSEIRMFDSTIAADAPPGRRDKNWAVCPVFIPALEK